MILDVASMSQQKTIKTQQNMSMNIFMNHLKSGRVKISLEKMKRVILVPMSVLMKRNVLMNANMLSGLENVPLCRMLFLDPAVNGVKVRIPNFIGMSYFKFFGHEQFQKFCGMGRVFHQ